MPEENNNNQYKDMSLFFDVENPTLRARNRGVVMGNIAMDGIIPKTSRIKPDTTVDLLEYFQRIPEDERKQTLQFFIDYLKQEGYTLERSPF